MFDGFWFKKTSKICLEKIEREIRKDKTDDTASDFQ